MLVHQRVNIVVHIPNQSQITNHMLVKSIPTIFPWFSRNPINNMVPISGDLRSGVNLGNAGFSWRDYTGRFSQECNMNIANKIGAI